MKYPEDGISSDGNCGIVAMACLAETSVASMFEHFRTTYNRRSNWRGSVKLGQVVEALAHFGIETEEIYKKKETTMTLKTLVNKHCRRGLYLVLTTSHMQVLYRGAVYDQSASGCAVEEHWG